MPDPEKIAAGWVESWEQLLAQNLPFKVFLKGRDLTYLACNENYAADHGLKPSEIFGRSDYDLYPRELAERYRAEDLRILETGRSETIEGHFLKDGQEHHGQTIKSLFRDSSGQAIGVLGTFWDVTELVQVKEALRESEELVSQFIRHSPIYAYIKEVTPTESRVLQASDNYQQMIGVSGQEMIGKTMMELFSREFAEKITADDWATVANGVVLQLEEDLNGRNYSSIKFPIRQGDTTLLAGYTIDITERKQLEEALRENEKRLIETQRIGKIGSWEWNPAENKVIWSAEMYDIFGLAPETVLTMEISMQAFHPEDRAIVEEATRKTLAELKPQPIECRILKPDGTVGYVQGRGEVLLDANGQLVKMIGIYQDITERKRVEEALRTSQKRLEMALVGGGLGTYEHNLQTGEIQVDARYMAMLGYAPGELDLTNMEQWEQLVHPEDLTQTRSPHTEVEYRMRHKDGHWIWVLDTSRVVEHDSLGLPLRMSGVHQDISERKQAEEALKEERTLFVAGPTVVFRWQPGLPWQVEYASPNVQELLGYPPEAFTSGSLSYADIVHPDDIDRLLQEHTNHDRQGRTHFEQEYRLQRSDGQILWVHDFTRTVIVNGSRQDHGYVTDITERKRAEEQLRQSEEQYHSVFNNFIDLYYQTDMQGLITNLSPSCFILSGWKPEELIGHQVLEFYPDPEQRKTFLEILRREGAVSDYEITLLHRNGRHLSVSVSSHLIRDEQGNPKHVEGTMRNITERKRAEEALRESESFNRGLVENVPDYIAIYGSDGKILHVNPASATVLGYSAEELVGTPVLSYIAEEYRHEVVSRMTQRREVGEVLPYEIDLLTHGGLRRSVIVKGTQIQYREIPATLLVLTDITERKQVEEALQESEEKHRAVVERANDGIVILQDGIIRFTNPSLFAMTGYETGEVEGMEFSRFFPEENWALVLGRYRNRMAGEKLSSVFETVLLHKSGKKIPVEMNGGLVQYEGKPADLVVIRDITERKQVEGEMDKTRADFIFGVSHELKTPLFLMDISLEMLENSAESGRAKRTAEFMETWKRNLHRLRHLVFNMVDSQRTQTMGFKIERQSTDFRALVERVVQENELLAEPKKVRITLDLAPTPPLWIDPEAVHRLVENLLTNAIKFSPRKGEVTIRLREEDAQAVLTVKDQGPGISVEEQKGLFLPFQRAATAVRSVIPGTGLGLYVAKIIVDAHGGTISLQSKVGKGTTITVRLPLGVPEDEKQKGI